MRPVIALLAVLSCGRCASSAPLPTHPHIHVILVSLARPIDTQEEMEGLLSNRNRDRHEVLGVWHYWHYEYFVKVKSWQENGERVAFDLCIEMQNGMVRGCSYLYYTEWRTCNLDRTLQSYARVLTWQERWGK